MAARFILIVFALFLPIELYATQQRPDYIEYKGKSYEYKKEILAPYLKKDTNKWKWLWEKPTSTNLWRGYVATFEVAGNKLTLKEIEDGRKNSILEKFLSISETKDSTFKIDWFTGTIILSDSKLLHYGYFEIHEYHLLLEFENGILIKESSMDCIEYLNTYVKKWLTPDTYQRVLEKLEHYKETKKGTKSEFLAKLKTEYKKKFGESMTDFELATENVIFSFGASVGRYEITVTRTLKGARAKYKFDHPFDKSEIELDIGEWLDFMRALNKCRIDKWQKEYGKWTGDGDNKWSLYIYSSDKDKFDIFSGYDSSPPPNWDEFKKVIRSMETRIRKDPATKALEIKLKTKYQRIYGVPITDLELFTKHVEFEAQEIGRRLVIAVTRTATGALAKYKLYADKNEDLSTELNIEEWLSFIKSLYKCCIHGWEERYYVNLPDKTYFQWQTEILFTDGEGFLSRGNFAYPPNWDEFKKLLDGIEAKMRK